MVLRRQHSWIGGKAENLVHPTENRELKVKTGGKCSFCRAPRNLFDRSEFSESHAYPFIHTPDVGESLKDWFGEEMKFDVIVGNPPYQMTGGAGGSNDSPLYHLFVQQALGLEPRFLSMVIPARWMAGGRGLDEFRRSMLSDSRISRIVDFPDSTEAFPGVEVKGGICFLLWDAGHNGLCQITQITKGVPKPQKPRKLAEFDVLVRKEEALDILRKVRKVSTDSIATLVSGDTPFGLATNFRDYVATPKRDSLELHAIVAGKRKVVYTARTNVSKGESLIDKWKCFCRKPTVPARATPTKFSDGR